MTGSKEGGSSKKAEPKDEVRLGRPHYTTSSDPSRCSFQWLHSNRQKPLASSTFVRRQRCGLRCAERAQHSDEGASAA